jgi:hypothetical protein
MARTYIVFGDIEGVVRVECTRCPRKGCYSVSRLIVDGEPPKVILLRLAVRFDDCAQDQYDPLPTAPPIQDGPAGCRKK